MKSFKCCNPQRLLYKATYLVQFLPCSEFLSITLKAFYNVAPIVSLTSEPATLLYNLCDLLTLDWGFPSGGVAYNLSDNAGDARDVSLLPGLGGDPGGRNDGKAPQSSCLENPMDRGAWWATVHRVAESGTTLTFQSTEAAVLSTQ